LNYFEVFFFFFYQLQYFNSQLAKDWLIYSYGKSFNGFAAKLTDEEVAKFSGECKLV